MLRLAETHSTAFELRRHFFLRFFDSDLVSTPGQWRVVAGGALGLVLSFSLIFVQAYYRKYLDLNSLPGPEPLRLAALADVLFLITLAMALIGIFTTLQWPSLFPGLRDYLALASLPVRTRDIFIAKFTALMAFAGLFTFAATFLPSVFLPALMSGRHAAGSGRQVATIFVSAALAALFVFFSLTALQGVLLNVLPVRQFTRVSLAAQGALLTILLCGLPLVLSIPNLQPHMNQRPYWAVWIPPFWFLGLDQVMLGNREPLALRLARLSLAGFAGAALAAIATYLWSYRRHKVRLLESFDVGRKIAGPEWIRNLTDRLIPDPREFAVFAFIAKTLARSRPHRLALTAFTALALAVIFESFASLLLRHGSFSADNLAMRQAAISAPLALSLFVLAGFRYLFRLPAELRANWIFRMNEPGNRVVFLSAVERFLLCWAITPVALLTLPIEIWLLGAGQGIAAMILCLLLSLALMEALLMQFEKIPFTSSYLPGRRPLVETLLLYGAGVAVYVSALSGLVVVCLQVRAYALGLFAALLAIWIKLRKARREMWGVGKLEFEELPEPAVQTLRIERD